MWNLGNGLGLLNGRGSHHLKPKLKISSERDPKKENAEVGRKEFGGTCFKIPHYQANMSRRGDTFSPHESTPEPHKRCIWSGERGTSREWGGFPNLHMVSILILGTGLHLNPSRNSRARDGPQLPYLWPVRTS